MNTDKHRWPVLFLSLFICVHLWSQTRLPSTRPLSNTYTGQDRDLEIARRYAPVFYQRLVQDSANHRFDSITNFDFDGDWIGNNNWERAADPKIPMKGYVYYSVIESENYYFITYACFHARDWSLLQPLMQGGLDKIQADEQLSKVLPPELRAQIEVNHENDLEGVQLFVAKNPDRLAAVETVAHNQFWKSSAEELELEGERPKFYVESQKHGIHRYPYAPTSRAARLFDDLDGPFRIYKYTGVAQDPEKVKGDTVGYDLIPMYGTLWQRAATTREPNSTFGEVEDFHEGFCKIWNALPCSLAKVATALRGDVAGKNRARMPWGWFSLQDPQLNGGVWFLDPAKVIRLRHREATDAGVYLSHPFLGVFRR